MIITKKLNNNYALAIDSAGKTIVVNGKGIGFGKMPYELHDLSKIDVSYYGLENNVVELIDRLPEDLVKISSNIVQDAQRKLQKNLNPNLTFTLADHFNFAIDHLKKGIHFSFRMGYEINFNYPDEMKISREATKRLEKIYKVRFPDDEVAIIAMHIIEAEELPDGKRSHDIDTIIGDIVEIVEYELDRKISRNSFSYYRFATHIQYLIDRKDKKTEISTENAKLYSDMIEKYPETYRMVCKIKEYFQKLNWEIGDEELLYLMLHINRLRSDEDCNH